MNTIIGAVMIFGGIMLAANSTKRPLVVFIGVLIAGLGSLVMTLLGDL